MSDTVDLPENPYNDFVQAHYQHPRNLGKLPDATHVGRVLRGDTMLEFHLRVDGHLIEAARFRAIGCAGTVAAGSAMSEWLTGRPLDEAARLTAGEVLAVLGGLPPERLYCADLAAEAIHLTVRQPPA